MASKKAGRLAGLAALAGLAYMNKDKLFGAKGETKAAETKAETKVKDTAAEDAKAAAKRDADEETMGYTPSGNAAMYEKEPGFETKTTPAKVASASSPASKPAQTGRFAPSGSPVLSDNPRKIGNAKAVVAQGGDRSARADMSKPAQTGNAKSVVAQGGDRSTRSDNAKPVVAPGGDRSVRSDNARPVFAPGGNRSVRNFDYENDETEKMKRGGKVKKMASGGMTSSASKRADGIASKGKTRGRMC